MRSDPRAEPYYWQAGTYQMSDVDADTDALAVDQGYVSVTPVSYDLTAHEFLPEFRRRFSRD
jgi:5'-nucleotidase